MMQSLGESVFVEIFILEHEDKDLELNECLMSVGLHPVLTHMLSSDRICFTDGTLFSFSVDHLFYSLLFFW